MFFYENYLKKNLSIVYMNYKCECCNVSFNTPADQRRHLLTVKHIKNAEKKTPNDYESEIFNLKHEHEKEIMKMKHEMELLKKDYEHKLELANTKIDMYKDFMDLKKETPTTQEPLSQPPQDTEETDENIDGSLIESISSSINEELDLCKPMIFRKDNEEEEQEKSICELKKDSVNEENFKLYDLYCNLASTKDRKVAMDYFMDYLYNFIQLEDYRVSKNNRHIDRIYFIKTRNTWCSEMESKERMCSIVTEIHKRLVAFSVHVYNPLRNKYSTTYTEKSQSISNGWLYNIGLTDSYVVKRLVKDKLSQP